MDNIFDTDATFNFNNISMTTPTSVGSGTFFSKIFVNKKPLYIQSPKCKTKQGIVQSGKKIHADLVFTNDDEEFIQWIETLEQTVKKHIYANRSKWFDTDMDEDDVDSYMTPTIKIFKSGKQYLLRVNVSQRIGTAPLKIYDENEVNVEMNAINENTSIITILEIQGIRCSSKSFQIDVELKQVMVLKPVNMFEKCIIKTKTAEPVNKANQETLEEPEEQDKEDFKNIEISVIEEKPLAKNDDIEEFDLSVDAIENSDTVHLKEKSEVYYQMYREAKQKAKLAKSLALSSYMEARRIKNLYMLDDIDSSDDDEYDLDNLEQAELQ